MKQVSHATERTTASRSMQPVEHAVRAPGGDGVRELSAAEATAAFHQLFAGLTERIRNRDLLVNADLVHGSDGVLRLAESPQVVARENRSERAAS